MTGDLEFVVLYYDIYIFWGHVKIETSYRYADFEVGSENILYVANRTLFN